MNLLPKPLLVGQHPVDPNATRFIPSASAGVMTSAVVGLMPRSRISFMVDVPAGVTAGTATIQFTSDNSAPDAVWAASAALTPMTLGAGPLRAETKVDISGGGCARLVVAGITGTPTTGGHSLRVYVSDQITG